MFTIERIRELLTLPLLVKIGLIVMAFAGLADVIAHLEAPSDGHLHAHTASEAAAHLAGFVSMVVIFVGVVIDGVRQGRVRRSGAARKESLDALR
jgi:uncharacterized membrane protein